MAELFTITEGWTRELSFTLLSQGSVVDLSDLDVVPVIKTKAGKALTIPPEKYRVDDDPTTGKVYWTPVAADLKAANTPYSIHWKVTGDDGVIFYPSGDADTIAVAKQ